MATARLSHEGPDMRIAGLTENHERSLLASVQHASTILRDCEAVLAASERPDPFSPYAGGLTPPQRTIAEDYLRQLRQQLLRVLDAVGLVPPRPSMDAVRTLSTAMIFLDDACEEMRARYLRGYGEVAPDAERVLDGIVSETQALVHEVRRVLTGGSDDALAERIRRVPESHPAAADLRGWHASSPIMA